MRCDTGVLYTLYHLNLNFISSLQKKKEKKNNHQLLFFISHKMKNEGNQGKKYWYSIPYTSCMYAVCK